MATSRVRGGLAAAAVLVTVLVPCGCVSRTPAGPGSERPEGTALRAAPTPTPERHEKEETEMSEHPYAGMWVTADGHVRHELLPDGRYVEARGGREAAYTGSYTIVGDHVEYVDDTGFTADGDFVDRDTLHHAGMVLTRAEPS